MEIKNLLDVRTKTKKRKPKFIRKDSYKLSILGKKRKKKQKWRRPRGRHSQVRTKRKGYIIQPSVGWGSPKKVKGFIVNAEISRISTLKELDSFKKGDKIIIAHVGKKKKIDFIKKASEKGIIILNLKPNRYEKNEKPKS
jgi:large subunit ribosomal protein L32e